MREEVRLMPISESQSIGCPGEQRQLSTMTSVTYHIYLLIQEVKLSNLLNF